MEEFTWTKYLKRPLSRLSEISKVYICGKVIFGVPEIPSLLGFLGAWMTFKKAEMAKTLRNGLSMIETNPLNHNWSHFIILSGLTLHQFQKKTAVNSQF